MQHCGLAPYKRLRLFWTAKVQTFCKPPKLFRDFLENIFDFVKGGLVFAG